MQPPIEEQRTHILDDNDKEFLVQMKERLRVIEGILADSYNVTFPGVAVDDCSVVGSQPFIKVDLTQPGGVVRGFLVGSVCRSKTRCQMPKVKKERKQKTRGVMRRQQVQKTIQKRCDVQRGPGTQVNYADVISYFLNSR